jgi:mono/diheme cytochrome c family protein
MKGRHLVRLLILGLVVAIGWAQDKPKSGEKAAQETSASPQAVAPQPVHGFKLTPEDAARKNPTKFTTLTVERGKKIYDTQCEMCHGTKGDGKGEVAVEMKITPPDFTKPETLDKRTDGELFAILGMGSEAMPGQGTRMSEAHKWNLINYLRALSGKQPQKPTGKEPEEGIILVPQEPK